MEGPIIHIWIHRLAEEGQHSSRYLILIMKHKAITVITILLAIAALIFAASNINFPLVKFDKWIASISNNPQKWINEERYISTHPYDQPLFHHVNSKDVSEHVTKAYNVLASKLKPKDATYFYLTVDMPTQETIWQYPDFFVRLSATSSIDSDIGRIEVVPGNYKKLRNVNHIRNEDGDHNEFLNEFLNSIDFLPPIRFFQNR